MSFDVAADAYDRFMGRYSVLLAPQMADFAGVAAGQRVLDVGCGPGALTAVLVGRLGPAPCPRPIPRSRSSRLPAHAIPVSRCVRASAEALPFPDGTSTRPSPSSSSTSCPIRSPDSPRWRASPGATASSPRASGITAVDQGPLRVFWQAAREIDPQRRRRIAPGGRPRGPPGRIVRGRRTARHRRGDADRQPRARQLRGVVGAIHRRRRPGRLVRGQPGRRAAGRAARAVPQPAAGGTVRADLDRLGDPRVPYRRRTPRSRPGSAPSSARVTRGRPRRSCRAPP